MAKDSPRSTSGTTSLRRAALIALPSMLLFAMSASSIRAELVRSLPELDPVEAIAHRALANDPDALGELAELYLRGKGVPQDIPKGLDLLRRSVELGSASAEATLGALALSGTLISQDVASGTRLLESAARKGDAWAAYRLGAAYDNGGVLAKDPQRMLEWYERAALRGDVGAQNNLGWILLGGHAGAPKDVNRAIPWLRRAAEQGQPNAQTTLGFSYQEGNGVPRDYALARYWNQEAADQGFPIAVMNLGEMAEKGLGQPVDLDTAKYFYRRAAGLGEEKARLRLAAVSGERWAQSKLADILYEGSGPDHDDKDVDEALKWYARAAAQGDLHARKKLEEITVEPVAAPARPLLPGKPSGRRRRLT